MRLHHYIYKRCNTIILKCAVRVIYFYALQMDFSLMKSFQLLQCRLKALRFCLYSVDFFLKFNNIKVSMTQMVFVVSTQTESPIDFQYFFYNFDSLKKEALNLDNPFKLHFIY